MARLHFCLTLQKNTCPKSWQTLQTSINKVYENRHKTALKKRKSALLEQTKETEQPQSEEVLQPTEEQQPEVAA